MIQRRTSSVLFPVALLLLYGLYSAAIELLTMVSTSVTCPRSGFSFGLYFMSIFFDLYSRPRVWAALLVFLFFWALLLLLLLATDHHIPQHSWSPYVSFCIEGFPFLLGDYRGFPLPVGRLKSMTCFDDLFQITRTRLFCQKKRNLVKFSSKLFYFIFLRELCNIDTYYIIFIIISKNMVGGYSPASYCASMYCNIDG